MNDFIKGKTKTCCVVLEKLDEKVINQYLQKCGLKKKTESGKLQSVNTNGIKFNGYCETKENLKENEGQKSTNLNNPAIKIKAARRKRKINSLCYTDYAIKKSVFEKKMPITECNKTIKLRLTSDLINSRDEMFYKLKKTCENNKSVTVKYSERSNLKIGEESNNMVSKALLEDFGGPKTENHAIALSTADTKIKIVEEYLNKNYYKIESSRNKEQSIVFSDSVLAKVFEEDEYDLREDNEDDKRTVIFEEVFHKCRNLNFLKTDEKEILKGTKLKKKEITDQKVKTLRELKRKSVKDGNSGAARKLEFKVMEPFFGQEVTEVPPSPEGVSENCLKKVRCLIQRVHEIYHIISQLQAELQRNNNGLSVHYLKEIFAEQIRFQREVRNSKKTIIDCYEKMLLLHKNADEVASIISNGTSLSAKDVIEVISQCLVKGAYELIKSKNGSIQEAEKEKVFQPPKASCSSNSLHKKINENSESLHLPELKMVQKSNYISLPSHSYFLPGNNQELYQKVTNESMILRTPTKENSKISSQNPSKQVNKISPPRHQMQRTEIEKLKSYLWQKKFLSQNAVKDSRIDQSQVMQCQYLVMPPSNDHSINGLFFPNQNLSYPNSNSPPNVYRLQPGNFLTVPSIPVENEQLIFSGQFLNCNSKNSSAHSVCQNNNNISNSEPKVLIPVVAKNIPQYNIQPPQNNALNNAVSVETYNGLSNVQRKILIPSNENRNLVNVTLTDCARFSNQKFVNCGPNLLLLRPVEMAKSRSRVETNVRTENAPNRLLEDSQVFDPTVPKKLTMKNCRLQAGPELDLKTEGKKVMESRNNLNSCQSLEEIKQGCHKIGQRNREQEDLRESRNYVCAQNDCKKPGVLICADCQSIIYCSETCQQKNWTQKHMVECYQLKKLRG